MDPGRHTDLHGRSIRDLLVHGEHCRSYRLDEEASGPMGTPFDMAIEPLRQLVELVVGKFAIRDNGVA